MSTGRACANKQFLFNQSIVFFLALCQVFLQFFRLLNVLLGVLHLVRLICCTLLLLIDFCVDLRTDLSKELNLHRHQKLTCHQFHRRFLYCDSHQNNMCLFFLHEKLRIYYGIENRNHQFLYHLIDLNFLNQVNLFLHFSKDSMIQNFSQHWTIQEFLNTLLLVSIIF